MNIRSIQTGVVSLGPQAAAAVKPKDDSSFASVTFPKPFPESSQVIVFPRTQTFNGPDTPGVRIDEVTTKGFKIRLNGLIKLVGDQHQSLSSGNHIAETIGWIAVAI